MQTRVIFNIKTSYLLSKLAGIVLLLMSTMIHAVESSSEQLQLHAEQWEVARHGESLIQLPVLKKLINEWSSKKNHKIELQYPGGEEGELWVRELMDWLISLGIPSQYLIAVPGSGAEDVIRFKIIRVGD